MKQYKKWLAGLLALALAVTPLAGCADTGTTQSQDTVPAQDTVQTQPEQGEMSQQAPAFTMEDYTLQAAADYDQVGSLFAGIVNGESYSSAENVGIVDEFFAAGDKPVFGGNYGESVSSTQLLPEGVLQADSVAVDAGYVYRVQDGELTILEAKGQDSAIASTTTVTSTVEGYESYEESAQGVLVQGGTAAVITYVYAWQTTETDTGDWTSETVSQTHLKLYDVSDKAAPQLVADYTQDGSYRDAFLAGGKLYLLTDYYVINLDTANPDTFIPRADGTPLAAEKLLCNEQADTAQFTVVGVVGLTDGAAVDTIALTGSFWPCFAAADRLLLSGWSYAAKQSERYEENQYQVTDFYSHAITLVADFSLAQGISLSGTACVNGRLEDAAQVDWQDGYLRLGTLAESYTNRLFEDEAMGFANLEMGKHSFSNEVHVLDAQLQPVGRLTGLSDSCLTYYQRFIGTTGYVLAYDAANSVYTLDLTDPAAPSMGKTLAEEDPAEILLRWGDRLLGITAGGRLQLLEAAGAELTELAQAELGSYAAVRYHMDSVLCDSQAGLLLLPGAEGLELYRVGEREITRLGSVATPVSARTRAVLLDGVVYVVGDIGFTAVDAATGEELAQVAVAVG